MQKKLDYHSCHSVKVGHKLRLKSPCDSPSDAINPASCKPLPSRTEFIALKLACYIVDVIRKIFAKKLKKSHMTQHGCKAFRREHFWSKALLEGLCTSVTSCMISKEEELSLVPLYNKKSIHPVLTMAPGLGINLKFFSNHAFR